MEADLARRFGGVGRLYGASAQEIFARSSVTVVGIGGVGSWTAEAFARSGIGAITLIDLDNVAESNTNRQIHALDDTFGMAKVTAMARRIEAINPACRVTEIEAFIDPGNTASLLDETCGVVVDAIDQVRAKVAMVVRCRDAGIPLIVAGGAGGKLDPTRIRVSDLSCTVQDPLLARVRAQLRKEHGFPRDPKRKFGIPAVFSDEPLLRTNSGGSCARDKPLTGLNCAGYGSSVCVTATAGFIAASAALNLLLKKENG